MIEKLAIIGYPQSFIFRFDLQRMASGTIANAFVVSKSSGPALLIQVEDGTVLEVNESLNAHPEQVNSDPYGSGWLLRVQLNGDLGERLLDEAGYRAVTEGQSH